MKNSLIPQTMMKAAWFILACISSVNAIADTDKQIVHHMQLQLRAAQQQNADLVAQVDTLKKQLGELESKRAALEKKLGGQTKQISELSDKQSSDKQQLADLTDKYKLLQQQYDTSSKDLQQTQAEKEQQKQKLDGEIQVCGKKNFELFQLSIKLMDKYQAKGVWDALLQAEPFTQLEKVKMENLLQEYRDRAETNRVTPESNVAQDAQRP